MRETLYKEDSNVLSYYIISTIMMNNYQGFLGWCNENNLSLLQFKKTTANIIVADNIGENMLGNLYLKYGTEE
jgi:hypothetical protein